MATVFAGVKGVRELSTAPTRRERLRTSTARRDQGRRRAACWSTGGPEAISLRAIAREMGMTAPAIYRYFASLDALVEALGRRPLRRAVAMSWSRRATHAGDDPLHQLRAMARAFRDWSVAHTGRVRADPRQPAPRHRSRSRTAATTRLIPASRSAGRSWRRSPSSGCATALPHTAAVADGGAPRRHLAPLRTSHGEACRSRWRGRSSAAGRGCTGWCPWRSSTTCGGRSSDPGALFELELSSFLHQLGLPEN